MIYNQTICQVGYDFVPISDPAKTVFGIDRFISDFNNYPNWLNFYAAIDKDLEREYVDNISRYIDNVSKIACIYRCGPSKVIVRMLSYEEAKQIGIRHEHNEIMWNEETVYAVGIPTTLWRVCNNPYRVRMFVPSLRQ